MLDTKDPKAVDATAEPTTDDGGSGEKGYRAAVVAAGILAFVFTLSGAAIRALGLSTPVAAYTAVGLTVATAAAGLLVKFRPQLKGVPWWVFLGAIGVAVAIVIVAVLLADPAKAFTGEITAEHRSVSTAITAAAGDQFVVTLIPDDGLQAKLVLSHGKYLYNGTDDGNGRSRIDETLDKGTWTATVSGIGTSTGHYQLDIAHDSAKRLAIGDSIEEDDLTGPSDSNGYRITVPRTQRVYIAVKPADGSDIGLRVQLRKANGFVAYSPRRKGLGWEYFRTFERGSYLVVVRSDTGTEGSYSLITSTDAPGDASAQTPPPSDGLVEVPHVVGRAQPEAEAALSARGLPTRWFSVCSGSVPAGVVRQVGRVVDNQTIVVVDDLNGVVPAEARLRAGTQLVVKVGNGSPCP